METIKAYFNYLSTINFSSWQDTFIKLLILILMVLVLLWLIYTIFSRVRPGNREAYQSLRDFHLDVNLLWAFGVVFVFFSGFWLYALFLNGINSLEYRNREFWLGLLPILVTYALLLIIYVLHVRKSNRKIKNQ